MSKFWLHFTSGYGAIWFILMLAAVLTHSRINTGEFGLFGFPILALIYASIRMQLKSRLESDYDELLEENRRLKSENQLLKNSNGF